MELPQDPIMLMSVINMKLRDNYASLDALCDDLNLNKSELLSKLSGAGFDYLPEANQFR
ncbi:MAG: DUF4250 domain-containing protein [Muribaculaceae bacterium]|nr:DUF4250 domain-containing protein [Bacteroidales bacterium]MDE6243022.1 DUF4250 domain-containing protein [Muribaculaceae bacterium]